MQITHYEPVNLGNFFINFKDIILAHAIGLVRIEQKKHEKKVSFFLENCIAQDQQNIDVRALTVQQRLLALINYLGQQAKMGFISLDVDVNDFINNEELPIVQQVEIEGITFRSLNGYEAEALEIFAKDRMDFILGSIALQTTSESLGLPYLMPLTNSEFALNILKSRFNILSNQSVIDIDGLMQKYYAAEIQLNNVINLTFDDEGYVTFETRGTDDAPMRFCTLSTFPGNIKILLG